jgi:hypothetical protein
MSLNLKAKSALRIRPPSIGKAGIKLKMANTIYFYTKIKEKITSAFTIQLIIAQRVPSCIFWKRKNRLLMPFKIFASGPAK